MCTANPEFGLLEVILAEKFHISTIKSKSAGYVRQNVIEQRSATKFFLLNHTDY